MSVWKEKEDDDDDDDDDDEEEGEDEDEDEDEDDDDDGKGHELSGPMSSKGTGWCGPLSPWSRGTPNHLGHGVLPLPQLHPAFRRTSSRAL